MNQKPAEKRGIKLASWLAQILCLMLLAAAVSEIANTKEERSILIHLVLAAAMIGCIGIYRRQPIGPLMMAAAYIGMTWKFTYGKFAPVGIIPLFLPAFLMKSYLGRKTQSESTEPAQEFKNAPLPEFLQAKAYITPDGSEFALPRKEALLFLGWCIDNDIAVLGYDGWKASAGETPTVLTEVAFEGDAKACRKAIRKEAIGPVVFNIWTAKK